MPRTPTYTPPGDTSIADGFLGAVPCERCGHPPEAHVQDLICPPSLEHPGPPAPSVAPPRGRTQMMYVERCGEGDPLHRGPAWIGRVTLSKSGKSVYYRGMHLQHIGARGVTGNHIDLATGAEYWVTGVKKRGSNRHPQGGGGPIEIDDDVREEYDALRKGKDT